MDPAEEIVNIWLQQQNFFVKYGIKAGRGKEIDFLAIDINNRRVHIEVHASVFPVGALRPWGPAKYGKLPLEERVKHYFNDKFVGATVEGTGELKNRCIQNTVAKILGSKNYDRWLVLGVLHKNDPEDKLKQEFEKHNVKVYLIRDILRETKFKGTAKNHTGRFIQLLASQLTDDAKISLLNRSRK